MTRVLFFAHSSKYTLGLPQGFRALQCPVYVLRDLNKHSIREAVADFQPDLLLTTGWAFRRYERKYIDLLVAQAAKYKVKHVYWATEDPRWTKECSLRCAKIFQPDAILTIHPGSIAAYQSLGIPAGHLDFGCNPEFNKQEPACEKYAYDIALVGNGGKAWKSLRKESVQILLQPLVERGYRLAIWGKRWDRFNEELFGFSIPKQILKGELPYEETNRVYNSAKIILGLQNDREMLTSRTFEVLASGGFLLTVPTGAVRNLFANKVHLVCSAAPHETVRLVDYYLQNSQAREAIVRQGQQEVYGKHTYQERARQILRFLQLQNMAIQSVFPRKGS